MQRKRTLAFRLVCSALALCAASGYTPVRPLSQLKEQNPDAIVELAPTNAQLVLPSRYVKSMRGEIAILSAMTNALWNGQVLLQAKLQESVAARAALAESLTEAQASVEEWREAYDREAARAARLDALRAWLVEQRDKAALPSTKAIYQALIDKIDKQN